jgi:hypothetical protein
MNKVELQGILGGALQEKFNKSFERVIDNLQDVNTSFKVKRKITISLDFVQNENRDDVKVDVNVVEKLAPQAPMATAFSIGKDLKTGEMYAEEYGKQIKGQMSFNDFVDPQEQGEESKKLIVDQSTGEILNDNSVVDFRKASVM